MSLSAAQKTIIQNPKRWKVAVCGRRFGKTHLAIRQLCYYAKEPNKEVWYVAPSYRAAKMIAWKKLKHQLESLRWIKKINESELSITLKNNSVISLKGADGDGSNLRGVGLDFLVLDEFADINQAVWTETLRATLADKQGKALFIGTPKGTGNWAHDLFMKSVEDPDNWASFTYSTLDGGRVSEEEIQAAKQDLDERTFRQEFMATFESYTGRCFYNFDRQQHVKRWLGATPTILMLGIDFNIDPMSCVVFALEKDVLHAIDEICMYSSNTQELVDEIHSRYPKTKIWAYPDPACRQRKTSAGGLTDLTILQAAGFVVKAPMAHNPIRDGINAVNSRLMNLNKEIKLLFDPRCRHAINAMERYAYKEGTSQPLKEGGHDHMSDAIRYCVEYMFPIKRDTSTIVQPRTWGHKTQ